MVLNSVLLYISYIESDYECYISIAINEDLKASYIQIPFDTDQLYEVLQKSELNDDDISWCIVSDVSAPEWNYVEDFRDHGYNLIHSLRIDEDSLCDMMTKCFGGRYCICESASNSNQGIKEIKVLFPSNSLAEKDDIPGAPEELLKKVEIILASDSPEKTELARIIEEKFKRMER